MTVLTILFLIFTGVDPVPEGGTTTTTVSAPATTPDTTTEEGGEGVRKTPIG
ncbi:MAG TPA: hypothetical protein VE129_07015 [Thermoanaerobaculia bacterium]|nr:hypothetical protein [Thermoanaerobaculia bacterium]